MQPCHPYQCPIFHWSYEGVCFFEIISEHVSFSLWWMEEADHSPVEAKSMGKSIPYKFLIKTAPPKVFPALCAFFILDFAWIVPYSSSPVWGQQGNVKHSEHFPYTTSTDYSIHQHKHIPLFTSHIFIFRMTTKRTSSSVLPLSTSFKKANIGFKGTEKTKGILTFISLLLQTWLTSQPSWSEYLWFLGEQNFTLSFYVSRAHNRGD